MYKTIRPFITALVIFIISSLSPVLGKEIQMACKHSFQGNYSGGDVVLKYVENSLSSDKAYIMAENKWVEICSDVNTHGKILINDFNVSCSIYLANWMDGKRKNYIWNFISKELYTQTLWKILNPETNKKEWQWRYSVGQVGSKDWKVINGWESNGIRYKISNCKHVSEN